MLSVSLAASARGRESRPVVAGCPGPLGLHDPEGTMDSNGKSGRDGSAGAKTEPYGGPSTWHAQSGLCEKSLSKLRLLDWILLLVATQSLSLSLSPGNGS